MQGRLKQSGSDVVAPPRTSAPDYTACATVCQQGMHNVHQTTRQRWRPTALGSVRAGRSEAPPSRPPENSEVLETSEFWECKVVGQSVL